METILYLRALETNCTPDLLEGVQRFAKTVDWHIQKVNGFPSTVSLRELVEFWNPVGLIVECSGFRKVPTKNFTRLPVVYLDCDLQTLPRSLSGVGHDSFATGRLAAKELLMTGYTNFAYVPYHTAYSWSNARESGFKDMLAQSGYDCITFGERTCGSCGPRYQKKLRTWLMKLPRPCGLFVANDGLAAEILVAITQLGICIPSEIAVVGVDNFQPICENTSPPLSSVQPDFLKAGELAAKALQELVSISTPNPIRLRFGPVRIVRRESSRVFHRYDPQVAKAVSLIRQQACDGLSAYDVLKLFSCSRRMAEIRFRATVGRSILDEIQDVRLQHAKELLRTSLVSIESIADFCGYRNPNSLRKLFKAETGMSLRSWQNHATPCPHHDHGPSSLH